MASVARMNALSAEARGAKAEAISGLLLTLTMAPAYRRSCGLRGSADHWIIAIVADAAGLIPRRRIGRNWHAGMVVKSVAGGKGAGIVLPHDVPLGCQISMSHGRRRKHGDRDQSRRQEFDCSHGAFPFWFGTLEDIRPPC
jgi:hypothetical protein